MTGKRLNIAILSVHSSPLGQPGTGDTGGMSIYIRELTRVLSKMGHKLDIYTRVQDSVTPEIIELDLNSRQIHILAGEPVDMDKLLIYSHVPDFASKVEIFRRINGLRYDLIFSHYWLSGIAAQYLHALWQVPYVLMFHTLGVIKNAIGIGEDEPDLRLTTEGCLANECDLTIATTQKEKSALIHYYDVSEDKISVIPCGVNLDLFHPLDKSQSRKLLGLGDENIILFIGRIERLKGIDKLIRALPSLSHYKPRLLIVGEDGNRQGEMLFLKNLAADLGVSSSISFSGLIDYFQLPLYYSSADVCVLPSYYESFGLVPLESLACGTPVVVTDVGDWKHIIRQGQTGYVVSDNNPQVLAENISSVLAHNNSVLNNPFVIRDSILNYNWKQIASSIENEFYRLLVNTHSGNLAHINVI
jgi:D-inositol-3-phosphate glycosyltransferase